MATILKKVQNCFKSFQSSSLHLGAMDQKSHFRRPLHFFRIFARFGRYIKFSKWNTPYHNTRTVYTGTRLKPQIQRNVTNISASRQTASKNVAIKFADTDDSARDTMKDNNSFERGEVNVTTPQWLSAKIECVFLSL